MSTMHFGALRLSATTCAENRVLIIGQVNVKNVIYLSA